MKTILFLLQSLFLSASIIQNIALIPNEDEKVVANSTIDIRVPGDHAALTTLLDPYLGSELTEETLKSLKQSIEQHFIDCGDSLVRVQIPVQKVEHGTVSVLVMPARAGKVTVCGNSWFSSQSIYKAFRLTSKDCIQEKYLLNQAAWINRNPFIHTDVILSKGKDPCSADVEIQTRDRFPVRVYAGVDNTGNSFSGNNRFWAGANISLGLKALLTYQFTSGFDFPEFLAHFGNLVFFLPWQHELSFYGGYATLHPTITGFDSKGQDIQASMRYTIPFKPLYTPFIHQFLWGADFKQTNSSLFFLGVLPDGSPALVPINNKTAQLFQGMLGYQLEKSWKRGASTFKLETYFSPAQFLPNQTSTDYNALREGAVTRYIYARAALGNRFPLGPKFNGSVLFRGQAASNALLPSEQYRLGGYDTVRGYQEGVFLADNAAIGNVELQTTPWSFFKKCRVKDSLYFLGFVDAAYGYNWKPSEAFPKDAWLLGAGPGIRYSIGPYLQARCDYGFRIHNTSFGNGQPGRIHFSAMLAY